jgi:hypothetical protein
VSPHVDYKLETILFASRIIRNGGIGYRGDNLWYGLFDFDCNAIGRVISGVFFGMGGSACHTNFAGLNSSLIIEVNYDAIQLMFVQRAFFMRPEVNSEGADLRIFEVDFVVRFVDFCGIEFGGGRRSAAVRTGFERDFDDSQGVASAVFDEIGLSGTAPADVTGFYLDVFDASILAALGEVAGIEIYKDAVCGVEARGDDFEGEFGIEDDADLRVIQLEFVGRAVGNHVASAEAGPGLRGERGGEECKEERGPHGVLV